jgi:hypothetical protein
MQGRILEEFIKLGVSEKYWNKVAQETETTIKLISFLILSQSTGKDTK